MFIGRRRPLMRAAMIGGAGYMAGRAGQRAAEREAMQDERISQLEATSQQPPPAQQPAAAPQPAGGGDMVGRLKELAALKDAGALTDEEFEAAKSKLLAS